MICKTRHKWEVSHCMLTSIIFDGNAQAKRRFLHKSKVRFDKPRLSSQGDRQYQHPNQNRSGTVSALSALRGCASFLREVWMPRPPMTRWTLKYSFEPLSHAAEKHCLRTIYYWNFPLLVSMAAKPQDAQKPRSVQLPPIEAQGKRTPLDYAENACEARSHWWAL